MTRCASQQIVDPPQARIVNLRPHSALASPGIAVFDPLSKSVRLFRPVERTLSRSVRIFSWECRGHAVLVYGFKSAQSTPACFADLGTSRTDAFESIATCISPRSSMKLRASLAALKASDLFSTRICCGLTRSVDSANAVS